MSEPHALYTRILESLIDLDKREALPLRAERVAIAHRYLSRDENNHEETETEGLSS